MNHDQTADLVDIVCNIGYLSRQEEQLTKVATGRQNYPIFH